MGAVGVDTAAEHLAHARLLARRDEELAREVEVVRGLYERAAAIRVRAREIADGLERIPAELAELEALRQETESELARARTELEAAEARLARLETSRRARPDEIDRARSEAGTARERFTDADVQLERLTASNEELRTEERALREAAEALPREAHRVADDIRAVARVTESARADPGSSMEELEEWGARVRSALFVARGTLETERERVVAEANALGTAVLGESLGASSVAVVRRRLEERLGAAG
jgi:chromosome segregation ATPase